MTEKRFTNDRWQVFDKDKPLLVNEQCQIMNELAEENEQLKKQLKQCETLIDNIKRGRVYEDKKRGMMWNE